MSNTELRRKLTQLTQRFVDDVLDAIRSLPLQELATSSSPRGKGAARREAPPRRESEHGRRTTAELERLREQILVVLAQAGAPLGASEIARQIGSVRSADLQFPMRQLREQERVQSRGTRTQTVYYLPEQAAAEAPARGSKRPPAKPRGKRK